MLFVGAVHARLSILKCDVLDRCKRIGMMGGRKPGPLWRKGASFQRKCALHDSSGDRSCDPAAVLTTLYHDRDDIFRLIERREATEPRNGVFLSVGTCLSRACLSRNLHVFQPCTAACSAIFVHHFPKAAPNHLDLFAREIVAQIGVDFWLR